jgi:subtilisin family serine protease
MAATGMVNSPGLGFNVITVGGADYQVGSTYPNIWPCSAWKNPGSTNGDRNKPEVIAPAAGLNTLEVCSGKEYFDSYTCDATAEDDGTSLSAPFVTGTAALLLQSAPVMWPETVKAIMMAAAQPLSTSDRDHYGAGLVNIGVAGDIVRGVNGNWRGDTPPQCGGTWPYTWPMYLIAGKQTRLAIAWTQDPNYNQYANQPQADLDLWVLDPQGNQFQSQVGNSWDNNYEFIDFVPPQTGTYKISVSKYRCDYTFASNRIGLAWHQAP